NEAGMPARETTKGVSARAAAARTDAPAAAPVPPVAAKPTTPTASSSATLLPPSDWSALIEAAELKGPAGQLARNASLIAIENNVVRLALNPAYEHMSAGPVVANIEERLSVVLGRSVKLRFEKAGSTQDTPAEVAQRERAVRQQEAETALGADPFVQ